MPCQALSPVVSGPAGKGLGKSHSCPYKIKIFKKNRGKTDHYRNQSLLRLLRELPW